MMLCLYCPSSAKTSSSASPLPIKLLLATINGWIICSSVTWWYGHWITYLLVGRFKQVTKNNSCAGVLPLVREKAIALGMLTCSFVEFSLLHRYGCLGLCRWLFADNSLELKWSCLMICDWLPIICLSLIDARLIEIFSGYSFVRWCQGSVHF